MNESNQLNEPVSPCIAELQRISEKIVRNKLVVGPGGNISVREGNRIWISPSGYALDEIPDEKWVAVDIESGQVLQKGARPSSEILMHLYIYRERPEINAVVHTHPPTTIGIISSGYDEIPPLFPDYVVLLGKVPCIDYIVPCSQELAVAVIDVLRDPAYQSLLMKNHGLITIGANLRQAYYRTELVEDAARVFLIAKTVGTPRVLTEDETKAILDSEAERYRIKLLESSS